MLESGNRYIIPQFSRLMNDIPRRMISKAISLIYITTLSLKPSQAGPHLYNLDSLV